ncbi:MAG: hydroxymethylpyrimidine/phosphomethylpyrimidine kinase, partial [Oxalobacteraceae bacterium]|nr:hydroxymethylpyrimidine/phosphomethylpyrimidine kinase [Oxalobacteraceae bacterium]
MNKSRNVPCVLVFAGLDPSGGAGIQADIQAISAAGVHALPIVTALTVQNNQRVMSVHPVDVALMREQCQVLIDQGTRIDAIKIGIVGQADNAEVISDVIDQLRGVNPQLPIVLDPVLASGHGDLLTKGDAVRALAPLLQRTTLITPNLPEAQQLTGSDDLAAQAAHLL